MASKMDWSKYLEQAETGLNADGTTSGGSFERWDPPAGWRGRCKIVKVNTRLSDAGEPGWGLWVEVVDEGDHKGKRFWFNANFSNTWAFKTKHAIEVMQGFGLSLSFIAGAQGNMELIATALEGKVGIVTAVWGKNKTNPDKPYANHTVAASKAAPPARPVATDDDEDEDDYEDYDDEAEEAEAEGPGEEPDPEEEDEEEEELPPPPPAKKKPAAKAAPAAKKASAKRARKDPEADFED